MDEVGPLCVTLSHSVTMRSSARGPALCDNGAVISQREARDGSEDEVAILHGGGSRRPRGSMPVWMLGYTMSNEVPRTPLRCRADRCLEGGHTQGQPQGLDKDARPISGTSGRGGRIEAPPKDRTR